MNKSLKQSKCESTDCKIVEIVVPLSPKLNFGCNYKNSIKETVFSLNENSTEKSSSNEEKAKETKTSLEGLTLKELPRQLKYTFLEPEKEKPVIISAALTKFEEHQLIEILIK